MSNNKGDKGKKEVQSKKKKVLLSFYCENCEKAVTKPKRKPMEALTKQIWGVIIVSTLGFAAIALVIYVYGIKKKKYCPECESLLNITKTTPDKSKTQIVEKTTTKEQETVKVEKKVEVINVAADKEEKEIINPNLMFCPFCGSEIPKATEKCPYCSTEIGPR